MSYKLRGITVRTSSTCVAPFKNTQILLNTTRLSPEKQDAPSIMNNPVREKSVCPQLAKSSPEQITVTTAKMDSDIFSNLNTKAQIRILPMVKQKQYRQITATEQHDSGMGASQPCSTLNTERPAQRLSQRASAKKITPAFDESSDLRFFAIHLNANNVYNVGWSHRSTPNK